MRRSLLLALLVVANALTPVLAGQDEEVDIAPWQESNVVFPPAPVSLQAFEVSAASTNRFFVDELSLSVGGDGVVRYVLVVETQGGARNVSYEGMRCETRERKIYATGRRDGSWSKSRNQAWEKIRDIEANRHHAALFLEYFCPGGLMVGTVAEARDALKRGGHPASRPW